MATKRTEKAKISYVFDGAEFALKDATATRGVNVWFAFANGVNMEVSVDSFPENIKAILTIRGLAEKIRDTYASSETVEDAYDAAIDCRDQLLAGDWFAERKGGATGPRVGDLIEAIRRVAIASDSGCDPNAVVAKYETVLKTETDGTMRKRLLANTQIAAAVAAIAAEKAMAKAKAATVVAVGDDELFA